MNGPFHSLKIEPTGDIRNCYSIFLDDKPVNGVTGLILNMGVDRIPVVSLTMRVYPVEGLADNVDIMEIIMEDKHDHCKSN